MPIIKRRQIIIFIVLNLIIGGVIVIFNLTVLAPMFGLRNDFYPRWVHGRAQWQGISPLSDEVVLEVERGLCGCEVTSVDQLARERGFYPFYTGVALSPFLLLPAQLASAIWMAIQLLSIIWTPIIWMIILKWRPPIWLLPILIISFTFVFRYPMILYIVVQFVGSMMLIFSLSTLLLLNGKDIWAGILLAFATIPPTMGAPIAGAILGVYCLRGRWKGLAAFTIVLSIWMLISILQLGWWVPEFVTMVTAYPGTPPTWPPRFIEPIALRWVMIIVTVFVFGWVAFRFWQQPIQERQIDFIVTTIMTGMLLMLQTHIYYLTLLIPVMIVSLYKAQQLNGWARWLVWLAVILAVMSPWFYYQAEVAGIMTRPQQSLYLPLHVGLIWVGVNLRDWFRPAEVSLVKESFNVYGS
jgi:hypothetical protein